MTHQLKFDVFQPFSPCTTNSGKLQKLRGTNLPFQELIVSRNKINNQKKKKKLKDVFFRGSPSLSHFEWDVA